MCMSSCTADTLARICYTCKSLRAQAPGGRCVDLALQPSPGVTEQPSAWLLTDEALHVLHPDSGSSARAVLSDAPLSSYVEEEPDERTQVSLQSACQSQHPQEGQVLCASCETHSQTEVLHYLL